MSDNTDLVYKLQTCANKENVLLVEIELEGDIVNQSWHEYDNCTIHAGNNDMIIFDFNLRDKKAGAFITNATNIQKYTTYNEIETVANFSHFYLHIKGSKPESLILEDMFKIFNNKIALPDGFNTSYLFNNNRSSQCISEKMFLNECFAYETFSVNRFAITPTDIDYRGNDQEMINLGELRDYQRENKLILENLNNIASIIKKMGIEVEMNKYLGITDSIHPNQVRARIYVPKWDLVISSESQDIETALDIFALKGKRICVVTRERYLGNESEKIVVYLVERKNKFYQLYDVFSRKQIEQQLEVQSKFFKSFDHLFQKDESNK